MTGYSDVADILEYQVRIDGDDSDVHSILKSNILDLSTPTYADEGLSPATQRSYEVRARNSYGWGDYSTPAASFTSKTDHPYGGAEPGSTPNGNDRPYPGAESARGRTWMNWGWRHFQGNGYDVSTYQIELTTNSHDKL